MTTACVDSSVVIDLLREYPPALTWMQMQPPGISITPIVWMEAIQGAKTKTAQSDVLKVLSRFDMVYLTQTDMMWAMQQLLAYRLSQSASVTDYLIASVNHRMQVPLYTRNLKHIQPIPGGMLTVKSY